MTQPRFTFDRRALSKAFASAAALAAFPTSSSLGMAQADATPAANRTIGMLIYPDFTPLDLVGPYGLLAMLPGRTTHLIWKDRSPIVSGGLQFVPTTTFAEAPEALEILFVPGGGRGTVAAIEDLEILEFLASRGERATYVTSVCTGSLILGAAGLLDGYRATSHWSVRHLLPLVGAEPVIARVVEDRNRFTGGGITAGIDFGLTLVARLAGDDFAKRSQLFMEYDPQPPFLSGTPEQAEPAVAAKVREAFAPLVADAEFALTHSPGYRSA